jgi:hypothetical protein
VQNVHNAVELIDEALDRFEAELRQFPRRHEIARRRLGRHLFKRQKNHVMVNTMVQQIASIDG